MYITFTNCTLLDVTAIDKQPNLLRDAISKLLQVLVKRVFTIIRFVFLYLQCEFLSCKCDRNLGTLIHVNLPKFTREGNGMEHG